MPQFNPEFFVSQLFWLIVIFGALYALMAYVVLPRMTQTIENRQNKIDSDLQEARAMQQEAQQMRDAYEKELAQAKAEAMAQAREVAEAANKQAAAQQAELNARLAKQAEQAEERIRAAREQAFASLPDIAAQTALSMSEKLAGSAAITAKDISKAIDSFAKDA